MRVKINYLCYLKSIPQMSRFYKIPKKLTVNQYILFLLLSPVLHMVVIKTVKGLEVLSE